MLTHVIQSSDQSLFLIDEPDIYLHSDLQRQLLHLLRHMGPDILIATHSAEIISEAETDDIVIISKRNKKALRIHRPSQLLDVFVTLGSNLNPILTQLAKTKRVIFVEGKDFQILGKFARKLGFDAIGNRSGFAVVPVEGFNQERIRSLKAGMETTLGGKILAAAIFDRDYRSARECDSILDQCKTFCDYATIHARKEIENFLLIPTAIDLAAMRKIADQEKRTGREITYASGAAKLLDDYATQRKPYITAQYLDCRRRFERSNSSNCSDATINEMTLTEFEESWKDVNRRLEIIPGKDALSMINLHLQERYGISITPTAIVDAMTKTEVPSEMKKLISDLSDFSSR